MEHLHASSWHLRALKSLHGQPTFRVGCKHAGRVKATKDDNRSDKALSTLDSLLGSESESDARDPNLVEWWRIRPRQAAPPRTTSISSAASPAGRFIANEEMLRNEVWAGRKTVPGQALELPKAVPYESYVIAFVHAAVYVTVVRVHLTQGSDAAAELLGGLELSRVAVLEQAVFWRFLSGCFVEPDLASLAVTLYGMLVVAPRVEASLGYRTFAATYALSAVLAADALIALPSADASAGNGAAAVAQAVTAAAAAGSAAAPSSGLLEAVLAPGSEALAAADPGLLCGGLGAVMGLAGSAVAHQLINGDVERQASGAAASSSSGSNGGGSERPAGPSGVVDVRTGVLLAGGAAVALRHALEPGGVALAAALTTGFGAGFLLTSIAGPRYQVTREVELPDGSMWIPDPDSVTEVTVVLDQTTSMQRTFATSAMATLASVVTLIAVFGGGR